MNAPLVKTGDVIGQITEKASKESGIPTGINLIASGSDKACEVWEMAVSKEAKLPSV